MAKKNKKKKNIPSNKKEEEKKEPHMKEQAPDRLPQNSETEVAAEKSSQQSSKKQQKDKVPNNSIAAIVLVLIGLAALIFIGYFLFTKLLRPQYLAELLPEEKTIALVEFTFDQTQWNDLKEALKPYPIYDLQKAQAFFEHMSSLKYTDDIQSWLGRRAGLALLLTLPLPDGKPDTDILYFIESSDHQKTTTALAGISAKPSAEYQKFPLYESSKMKGYFFTFINNYVVITPSQPVLQHLVDTSSLPKLYTSEAYRKVTTNLPTNSAVFVYADMKKILDEKSFSPAVGVMPDSQWRQLKPFFELFSSVGITMKIEKGRLIAQVFTGINKEKIDGKGFIEYSTKYQGNMLSLANEETLFFVGGHDVVRELSRLETVFQSGTKASAFTFEGLLEGQKEHYFGKDIQLKDDIYPVLSGEYLVAVEGTLQNPIFSFFLAIEPENRNRVEALLTSFIKTGGIFSPQVKEVTLPDGTKGQEVVAVGQIIKRTDIPYGNNTLINLRIGEGELSLHLSIVNNMVLMSTNLDSLKKIIDRAEGKKPESLMTNPSFSPNTQLVLKTADEVMGVKAEALLKLIPNPEVLIPYFKPFNSVIVGKNFFEDGISEIYLISLK